MLRAVLLDLDGTVYRGKTAISGAADTISALRKRGVNVFFLTNAATKSRKKRAEVLESHGIRAAIGDVYSSSYAVAEYVRKNHPGKTVYSVCEAGMEDEILEQGLELVNDESAGVVVVGLDRNVDYEKLSTAHRAISKGAKFIATNDDPTYPVEKGFLPGSGAIVAAVERSTGAEALIIGKPNPYMIDMVLKEHGFSKDEVLIVGDRLETDIQSGINAGIGSALVLSGVAKKEDIEKTGIRPDFVFESINDIFSHPLCPLSCRLEAQD